MEPMTPPSRSESVIIYASKDIKQLPLTLVPSPISQISSPIYYFDSNQLVNCNLVSLDSSEKQTDSSESSINLFDVASTIQLSPVSENDFSSENHNIHHHRTKLKRGRPKLETITSQMESNGEDNCSDIASSIRCKICRRSFPREKSLQAHIRIHTGERPYLCDFPDCGRRFAQSGQLRTHQRLHTGEKPFVCNFEGCENRFTHANRRCPAHPMVGVSRDKESCSPQSILKPNSSLSNASKEVADWLSDYYRSVKRQGIKRNKDGSSRPFKGRKLDLDAADMGNSSEENSAPVWKKKRAALQLQAKKEFNQKPTQDIGTNLENIPNDRLLGALALMELANCPVVDLDVKCQNALNASYETLNTSFNSSFNCSLTENNSWLASERNDSSTEDNVLSSSPDDIIKKEKIALHTTSK